MSGGPGASPEGVTTDQIRGENGHQRNRQGDQAEV